MPHTPAAAAALPILHLARKPVPQDASVDYHAETLEECIPKNAAASSQVSHCAHSSTAFADDLPSSSGRLAVAVGIDTFVALVVVPIAVAVPLVAAASGNELAFALPSPLGPAVVDVRQSLVVPYCFSCLPLQRPSRVRAPPWHQSDPRPDYHHPASCLYRPGSASVFQ